MNPALSFKKSVLRSAVVFVLGCGAAHAATSTGNNFTMLSATGAVVGGTNDVTATWDGSCDTGVNSNNFNMTLSSPTAFLGYTWSAHHIRVFGPGTYTINTACSTIQLEGGFCAPNVNTALNYTFTIGGGQIGAHMLLNWGAPSTATTCGQAYCNIDVVEVWNQNVVFGPSTMYTGAQTTLDPWSGNAATAWSLMSGTNGNSINGTPMLDGAFTGYNANFNLTGLAPQANSAPCGTTMPIPSGFSFTPVTDAPLNTTVTSNTYTVSGLGGSSSISVTGGTYSINGGAFTNAAGTVSDGQTVTARVTSAATYNTPTKATLTIGGGSADFTVTTTAGTPAGFSFAPKTGVPLNTAVGSAPYTVSGLGTGLATTISVSGGRYSLDGGNTFITGSSTVVDGDTVIAQVISSTVNSTTVTATVTIGKISADFSVTTLASAAVSTSTGNNFTMLDPKGGVAGGTNDVAMVWDGLCETSASSTNFSHMSLSSNTPFVQFKWTAHHIRVFCPGTYTINTACTTGNTSAADLDAGTCTPNADPTRNYTFTVGANQLGAHMLFDWNTTTNIDIVDVWDKNAVFGPSPLYTGPTGFNAASMSWNLMSSDWDGDGQNGAAMIDGPFLGFKANFNINYTGTTNAPNPFVFTAQLNVPLSTVIVSNPITVSGINTAVPISVSGGEYSINGGAYTSSAGTVSNGQSVTVRQTSAASYSTTTSTVITIAGISATFSSTTIAASPSPAPPSQSGGGGGGGGGGGCSIAPGADFDPLLMSLIWLSFAFLGWKKGKRG